MQLREIEYVLAISNARNISKAAEALHVSQSALSQAIKKMEFELGAPIFFRTGKTLQLTKVGEVLVNDGLDIVTKRDALMKKISSISNHQSGSIRIGVTPLYLRAFFPPVFSEFMQRYPDIHVTVEIGQSTDLEAKLLNKELDLAIFSTEGFNPALKYNQLFNDRLGLAVNVDNPLNKFGYTDKKLGFPFIDLHNAKDAGFIGYTLTRGRLGAKALKLCQKNGFEPDVIKTCTESSAVIALIASGYGVGVVSWMAIYSESLYNLKFYNFASNDAERTYYTVFQNENMSHNGITLFQQVCEEIHDELAQITPELQFYNDIKNKKWE